MFKFLMPPEGSTLSTNVDGVINFIIWICLFFFLLVVFLMTVLILKYKRKPGEDNYAKTPDISHHTNLEIFWTAIPLVVLLTIFFSAFKTYMSLRVAPSDAMEVLVTAKRWNWQFTYNNGITTYSTLTVPAGRPVKLTMMSVDVIHCFFVPDFRVKQDVVPNKYSSLWFEPKEVGDHPVYCAEFCGQGHSTMMGLVNVLPPEKYDEWVTNGGAFIDPKDPPAVKGKIYYGSKSCNTCHTVDGSALTGPSWKGLYGKTEKFSDGSTHVIDDNYIRESILNPGAKVVAGFGNVMPSFVDGVNEDEIRCIIEYIKTLK